MHAFLGFPVLISLGLDDDYVSSSVPTPIPPSWPGEVTVPLSFFHTSSFPVHSDLAFRAVQPDAPVPDETPSVTDAWQACGGGGGAEQHC